MKKILKIVLTLVGGLLLIDFVLSGLHSNSTLPHSTAGAEPEPGPITSAPSVAPITSPSSGPLLNTTCTIGWVFNDNGTGNNGNFTPQTTEEWWVREVQGQGIVAQYTYPVFQATVAQSQAENEIAGPFASQAEAQQVQAEIESQGSNYTAPLTDPSLVVQVTATNDNSSMVLTDSVNVDLYDRNGDLLTTDSVALGVQGIAPGVTWTNFSPPGEFSVPSDAASCETTTYNNDLQ
jgi:hypothetical protein